MVLDGTTLYVDRNAIGDLSEPDNRLEPTNPKDGSNRFSGSGSHTTRPSKSSFLADRLAPMSEPLPAPLPANPRGRKPQRYCAGG
jgi:hypothetical protein